MNAWCRSATVVLLGSIAACSSSGDGAPAAEADAGEPACAEGTPGCVGWISCPPEFEADPSGSGCRAIVAAEACAAGTMPRLGSAECVRVGTTTCARGFETDPSGWGCRAIVPAKACAGATRDAIGAASCAPVGSCDAPFPPPGALVVNKAFTDAELGPKKYKTIQAAMLAANAGEVVAIESGEYAEGIVARSNVTVAGRCAERVRLVGTGLDERGVLAAGVKNAVVKGVTLFDHDGGARATGGATLTLQDTVVESPRSVGLVAWQPKSVIRAERVVVRKVKPGAGGASATPSVNADEGGTVELVDSAVTSSWEAGVVATNASTPASPSVVKLTRTVIRDTNLDEHSQAGAAVVVSGISRGEVTESAILDTRRVGALTVFDEPELTIARSEIRRTLDDANPEVSAGVYASGGKIALEDVSIHDAVQGGLFARDKGAISAKHLVIRGTKPGADGLFGVGAWADTGGQLVLEDTAIVDNAYYGVTALDAPATATLKDVFIRGTAAQKVDGGGLGRGVNVEDGATVDLDGVSIVDNDGEGLFVRGETAGGKRARATAKRLLIAEGRTFDSTGVFLASGAVADLDGALIRAARRAGVVVSETVGAKGSLSEARLAHVVVRDTRRDGTQAKGAKSFAVDGVGIGSAGKLTVRASAILDNVQFGIVVSGPRGTLAMENSVIGATKMNADGSFGHGLVAFSDSAILVRDTAIDANNVGLLFDGASAVVAGSRVRGNSVGIHTQHGSTLVTGVEAPEAPEEGVVFVTDDSLFVDNASRVGGGELPLPANPFATTKSKK
ncbi:MAG: right-handed parallel beta-helix repeat-containing protein [Labilithrix sp.]|nr:right-handed parallel beta-helix repeat-containing protein [Labilithrix sp.]